MRSRDSRPSQSPPTFAILARHTGRSAEQISKDTDRDFIMTAQEAVACGIVDEVVTSRKPVMAGAENVPAATPSRNGGG